MLSILRFSFSIVAYIFKEPCYGHYVSDKKKSMRIMATLNKQLQLQYESGRQEGRDGRAKATRARGIFGRSGCEKDAARDFWL